MLKLFNKEKKKAPQISNVLPVEEFFRRDDYEINEEFWKMNASQLEEVCKKQEKFIKKLKTLYQQHLEYLDTVFQKHEEEKKKLRTEIEEWQIKNQSNFDQKQLIEEQYKSLYDQHQINAPTHIEQQQPQTLDLLDLGEPKEEEIVRLRQQCEKVCEEMQRLQEDNNDLNCALESEKSHKDQQKQAFDQQKLLLQQKIEELEKQIQEAQKEYQIKINKLEEQISSKKTLEENSQEQHTKIQELESKLLQEKIKLESKIRDLVRVEELSLEQKNQIEQLTAQSNVLQSKVQIMESKRQKEKVKIADLNTTIANLQNNIDLIQYQQKNELQTINLQLSELQLKNQMYEALKVQFDQLQNSLMDKNVKIQQLFHQISELEQTIDTNKKAYESREEANKKKEAERENLIQHLTLKRENAKVEIEQLNDKILQCMKVIDSIKTKASKNNEIQQIIKHNSDILNKSDIIQKSHRRIQLFPTIYRCLSDLRKLEDKCYKLFISAMVSDFKIKEETIQIERYLNDIGRRSQDIVDLLDEMGLK